jgi:predicted aspartyl protease
VYAKGVARIPRRSNGVSTTKIEIKGVEGTFIVDTGASFVTNGGSGLYSAAF